MDTQEFYEDGSQDRAEAICKSSFISGLDRKFDMPSKGVDTYTYLTLSGAGMDVVVTPSSGDGVQFDASQDLNREIETSHDENTDISRTSISQKCV